MISLGNFIESDDYLDADLLDDPLLAGYRRKDFKAFLSGVTKQNEQQVFEEIKSIIPEFVDGHKIDSSLFNSSYVFLGEAPYIIIVSEVFDYMNMTEGEYEIIEENDSDLPGHFIRSYISPVINGVTGMTPRGILARLYKNGIDFYPKNEYSGYPLKLDYTHNEVTKTTDSGDWVVLDSELEKNIQLDGSDRAFFVIETLPFNHLRLDRDWQTSVEGTVVKKYINHLEGTANLSKEVIYKTILNNEWLPKVISGRKIDNFYYKLNADAEIINTVLKDNEMGGISLIWISTNETPSPALKTLPLEQSICGDFVVPKLPITLFQINVVVIILLLIFDKEDEDDRQNLKWALGGLGIYGIYTIF